MLRREKNLEEAKKIVIKEDKSLPEAKQVVDRVILLCFLLDSKLFAFSKVKIKDLSQQTTDRVKVYGWVHRLRRQGRLSRVS